MPLFLLPFLGIARLRTAGTESAFALLLWRWGERGGRYSAWIGSNLAALQIHRDRISLHHLLLGSSLEREGQGFRVGRDRQVAKFDDGVDDQGMVSTFDRRVGQAAEGSRCRKTTRTRD